VPTLSLILLWLLNGLLVLLLPPLQRGIRGSQPLVFSAQVIVKQAFSLPARWQQHSFAPRVHFSVKSQLQIADQEKRDDHSLSGRRGPALS